MMTSASPLRIQAFLLALSSSALACEDEWTPPNSIAGRWELAAIGGAALPVLLGDNTTSVDGEEQVTRLTLLSAELVLDPFTFGMLGTVVYQRLDVPADPDTVTHVVLTQGELYDYADGDVVFQSSEFFVTLDQGSVDRQGRLIVEATVRAYGPADLIFVRVD